jgi:translation initiation factor 4B
MSKKPKAQKVSLSQFLDTGDSWADDVSDLPSAPAASAPTTTTQVEYSRPTFGESRGGDRYESDRAPREDIPIPDEPPFTAYVGNLSFSTTEAEVKAFFSESSVF